jgi:hypothetical protein
MSERGWWAGMDEPAERRLADLLKQSVPAPPRDLSAEEIMVTIHDRSRKSWTLPVLSAAAVVAIGVTIGVVATNNGGPARTTFSPAASQSSASPSASPSPVAGGATPTATPSPIASGVPTATPTPSASAVPGATPTAIPTPVPTAAPHAAVVVPNVVGQTYVQAEHVLANLGFTVVIAEQWAPSGQHVAAGTVWAQNPPAGSTLPRGATVTLEYQP